MRLEEDTMESFRILHVVSTWTALLQMPAGAMMIIIYVSITSFLQKI